MKIATFSDPHGGSRFGVTPPDWQRDVDGEHQAKLYDWLMKEIKKHGPYDLCVLNGDGIEGPGKKDTLDLITTNTEEQADITIEWMSDVPTKEWRVVKGTPYHATSVTKHERRIAEAFDTDLIDTLRLEVEGVKLNYRHTGHRSDTAYGQGTQNAKPTIKDQLKAARFGKDPAHVYFRSHVHYFYVTAWRSQGRTIYSYQTPCLKYPFDEYGTKLDPMFYDMGFLVHEYKGGEIVSEQKCFFNWEVKSDIWNYERLTKQ